MHDVLFKWPAASAFGARVPKEKIYTHGSVSTSLREQFVADVDAIEWSFKLSETTINLRGSDEIPELQVFRIAAKGGNVTDAVLEAVDHAVAFPIVFEIARGDGAVRMAAAVQKASSYYSTGWQEEVIRKPLPTAVTLQGLYAAILDPLLPTRLRVGESTTRLSSRLKAVARLEREVAAKERSLRNEPQLNRKLELRRSLIDLRSELESQR